MRLPIADSAYTRTAVGRLIGRRRRQFVLMMLAQAGKAVFTLLGPWLIGILINEITHGTTLARVNMLALLVIAAIIGETIATALANLLAQRFGEIVFADMREELVDTVMHLPLSTVEAAGTGDLLGRSTNDVNRVGQSVRGSLPRFILVMVTILLTVVAAFFVNPLVALGILIPMPLIALVLRWYYPRAVPTYRADGAAYARLNGIISETIEGHRAVDALDLKTARIRRLERGLAETFSLERYSAGLRAFMLGGMSFVSVLPPICVMILGAWGISAGWASLGAVTTIVLYAWQVRRPIDELSFYLDDMQVGFTSLSRIVGVQQVPPDREATSAKPAGTSIEAHAVTYAYNPGQDVLHEVDLRLIPGERLAIVGPSGAGKSTLGRMLAGIHPPTSGSVTVGGVELTELPEAALHENVVLVTQEYHVFVGTLAENLRLARKDATDAQLRAALEAVEAWEWVEKLEDGLETRVGAGGTEITDAQAQQLALARIILMDPHTLILDEATSLIDPTAARSLERSLSRVLAGRTVVAIAHRLYTAHDADRIAVVIDGRIVELGTHDELVAAGGEYASLWKSWQHH